MTSDGKISVMFVLNSLCVGGAERQTVYLYNGLDKNKFDVSMAYLKPEESLAPEIDPGRRSAVFCCDVTRRIDPKAVKKLARHVVSSNVDIIICTNQYPALYGYLTRLSSGAGRKLVIIFRTTVLQSLYSNIKNVLYKRIFNRSDKVIFVSVNQLRYWSDRGIKADTGYIHNGVNADHFTDRFEQGEKTELRQKLGIGDSDYVVGNCAVLRPVKRHKDLIDATAALAGKGIDCRLLIIGDGPTRGELEKYIHTAGMSDRVIITGFIKDVRPYLSICDCVAISSSSETFSNAILEAMSMGKPVISADVGGADEQIDTGVNGFIYPMGDVNALAGHMETLRDVNLRTRMGIASRQLVEEKFRLEKMIASYENMLSNLVSRQP